MTSVSEIADEILALERPHPIRVGIDGFCAAGKTTLGDALGLELVARGRSVIRACGDDFQNPPSVRYQLGHRSPEGFFRHAMDFASLRRELLDPLGPGGALVYRTTVYDVFASRENLSPRLRAEPSQILVLDGLFLHVPELAGGFDLTVLVEADFETCIARARTRKQERYRDADGIEALYRERYVPGFELYLNEVQPQQRASMRITTS
jgi:uridine kinase